MSDHYSICSRCGTAIKNVFVFDNKPYGSECILHVTGMKPDYWVTRFENGNRVIDPQATAEREAAAAARRVEVAKINADNELKAKVKNWHWSNQNQVFIKFLKNLDYQTDFTESLIFTISWGPIEDLSNRQYSILVDMWAKSYGRRGSKKYQEAETAFYDEADKLLDVVGI